MTKELLFKIQPNLNSVSTPMTYMHEGNQYVVVAIGGSRQPAELVAFKVGSKCPKNVREWLSLRQTHQLACVRFLPVKPS